MRCKNFVTRGAKLALAVAQLKQFAAAAAAAELKAPDREPGVSLLLRYLLFLVLQEVLCLSLCVADWRRS